NRAAPRLADATSPPQSFEQQPPSQPPAAAASAALALPAAIQSQVRNGGLPVTPVGFSSQRNDGGPATADGDTELVVIVRSKRSPDLRSEIYLVDQASPDLLSGIVVA